MLQVSQWLSLRLQGHTRAQIGESQDPKISHQAVAKGIKLALGQVVSEPFEHIRMLELLRLDQLLEGIYPRATQGDMAAITGDHETPCRKLGLDLKPGSDAGESDNMDPVTGDRIVRLEIVNNPEVHRREYLYRKRIEALGGNPDIEDDSDAPKLN